ncbi:hypothetical protein BD410DRAFT_871469 [Rickenella mellea]|uniref:Uncharacterized protein n=1 Tax=Rickenella mellea TaxID=50990 RepID=A0A4Y7PFZ9_9AGAM|nr:hypothetical protein BD410DRAFT_871469 [Rickenella mellea]
MSFKLVTTTSATTAFTNSSLVASNSGALLASTTSTSTTTTLPVTINHTITSARKDTIQAVVFGSLPDARFEPLMGVWAGSRKRMEKMKKMATLEKEKHVVKGMRYKDVQARDLPETIQDGPFEAIALDEEEPRGHALYSCGLIVETALFDQRVTPATSLEESDS